MKASTTQTSFPSTFKGAPVLPVAKVVEKEQEIAAGGTPLKELMARAGQSVCEYLLEKFPEMEDKTAVVFAGSGNNGGDGWVVAHHLAQAGWKVSLVSAKTALEIKAEPAHETAVELSRAWDALDTEKSIGSDDSDSTDDGSIGTSSSDTDSNNAGFACVPQLYLNPSDEELSTLLSEADVVVDGILGTGFSQTSIRAPYDSWIALANKERADREETQNKTTNDKNVRGKLFCLAIDIPSGVSADTGLASIPCFEADATVTMIVYKPAFTMEHCAHHIGEAVLAPLI
ncbi:MAG: NAD(P)H-hydrate epimerase [Anaerotardibacter sp.]